ncbi:MAG: radical domain protein [Eubacterium sp.]|jgi:MoaA/NifB/PqqE/SkfB family radical SAM enzyme|nr:radical domain protein [Eubacterium sp.]
MSGTYDLTEYMNGAVENLVKSAIRSSLKNPREMAFLVQYSLKARQAEARRRRSEAVNQHIPPFLIASISKTCNLYCKGCYARANKSCSEAPDANLLSMERWSEIFCEAEELGVSFILLAGGEPMMRRELIEKAAEYKGIVFPVFTNGTMFDEKYRNIFNENRNLLPILSIEGEQSQTDLRRGAGTYITLMDEMEHMNGKGIFYGASVTVTTDNLNYVTGKEFVETLYNKGCKILFYVEYVPVERTTEYLAPGDGERQLLEEKLQDMRKQYRDMIFLAFPGDEKSTGGCLAAGRGFFHINADGGAEPCPFSPFSDISLKENSLLQALKSPLFMKIKQAGRMKGEHKGGCILFENEEYIASLIE